MMVAGAGAIGAAVDARGLPFKIAGLQLDRLMVEKLAAGIGIVILHGAGLNLHDALALTHVAGLVAIILRFDALVGAEPPARSWR